MQKFHINLGLIVSSLILIFGILIYVSSMGMRYWSGYGPGESFVSIWSSGFLIFLSILNLYKSAKEKGLKLNEVLPKNEGITNLLITWTGILIFLLIVIKTGFVISSLIMLFLFYSLGYKRSNAILISILVTIILYIVFKILLKVPIPVNYFGF